MKKTKERTQFETLEVYQLSESLADMIWDIVGKWKAFEKDTIGKQIVRASDSIGANIAEGTGRGSFGDNIRFAKISRASLFETKHWLRRAYKRKLLSESQTNEIKKIIEELSPKISAYINSIGTKETSEKNES